MRESVDSLFFHAVFLKTACGVRDCRIGDVASAEMIVKQQIADNGSGQKENELYGETGEETAQKQSEGETHETKTTYFFHCISPLTFFII